MHCSSGETVDDCTGLQLGEYVEEPEHKHLPVASTRQHKSGGGRSAGQQVTLNGAAAGRAASRSHMEQEKRMRREIANSNERRRMQSINAGFQSLRTLLPHHEGEKLSKVSARRPTPARPPLETRQCAPPDLTLRP